MGEANHRLTWLPIPRCSIRNSCVVSWDYGPLDQGSLQIRLRDLKPAASTRTAGIQSITHVAGNTALVGMWKRNKRHIIYNINRLGDSSIKMDSSGLDDGHSQWCSVALLIPRPGLSERNQQDAGDSAVVGVESIKRFHQVFTYSQPRGHLTSVSAPNHFMELRWYYQRSYLLPISYSFLQKAIGLRFDLREC